MASVTPRSLSTISKRLDLSYKRSVMQTIPITHGDEPSLQQLRVFDGLLREHSLTHAARELGITQPALSKSLAQLRRYFDDPLFVRTGFRMEPTPKALQLQAPVRAILDRAASLRSESALFEPRTSHRTFNFSVVDAGLLKLLPPLVERLLAEAPNVRLQVLQPDLPTLSVGSNLASSILRWVPFHRCLKASGASHSG
jgi:DNA-binding transcriptional LysR family regulator